MKDLILETKLDTYKKALDINNQLFQKQRITYAMVFGLLGILVTGILFFLFGTTYLVLGLFITTFLVFIGWKYMYFQLVNQHTRLRKVLGILFPDFLTTYISILSSQDEANVLSALNSAIPYIKEPLRGRLVVLVRKATDNPTNEGVWKAFNEFAKEVGDEEAEPIMGLIVDMYTSGVNKESLSDLEDRVKTLRQDKIKEYADEKNRKMKNKAGMFALMVVTAYIFGWAGIVSFHLVKSGLRGY